MDSFERITGFAEGDDASTQARLTVDGEFLVSKASSSRHRIGQSELVTLQTLRLRRVRSQTDGRCTSVHCLAGVARELNACPEFAGVASSPDQSRT